MDKIRQILNFLNPLAHLGDRRYSFLFPLLLMLFIIGVLEVFSIFLVEDIDSTTMFAIVVTIVAIIYFSFREGIRGGLTATAVTLLYYLYIIYSRGYQGRQLESGLYTTVILGSIYLIISLVIGWLKQKIDSLIEKEAFERRRLQAVIQQIPVGVLISDSEGKIVISNEQTRKIIGRNVPLGLKVGTVSDPTMYYKGKVLRPDQWPMAQALKSGRQVLYREFKFVLNGRTRRIQVSAAPVTSKNRKIIAVVGIIQDITTQKELERQKDEFIGIASHELKTPVTSIKAYTQVLKHNFEKLNDLIAVEQLEKMDAQLNKLTDLIGDLLDVTKIDSGKIYFNEQAFDFDNMVKDHVAQMQLTASKHSIELKVNTKKQIYGDPERVGQVITNLISNAIKYSPHSDKIIVKGSHENGSVNLCVQDFGIGISKKNKDKVFDRFQRASGPNNQTYPGLGLGLYISSEIIKRMKGKIWVESKKGEGSTFCFSLPIYDSKVKSRRASQ